VRDTVRITCLLACAYLAGCGPQVGNVIDIKGQTIIILNQHDYEEYAELKASGADTTGFTAIDFDGTGKPKWSVSQITSRLLRTFCRRR
jgi:hypothetical protein